MAPSAASPVVAGAKDYRITRSGFHRHPGLYDRADLLGRGSECEGCPCARFSLALATFRIGWIVLFKRSVRYMPSVSRRSTIRSDRSAPGIRGMGSVEAKISRRCSQAAHMYLCNVVETNSATVHALRECVIRVVDDHRPAYLVKMVCMGPGFAPFANEYSKFQYNRDQTPCRQSVRVCTWNLKPFDDAGSMVAG